MRFQEITIGELTSFIKSDLYKNSKNLPITEQRAFSQAKNPRANSNDVALIIAVGKTEQIVGFIGALPEKLPNNPSLKIAWNSCWWIDPINGKGTAMPLFIHFLKSWDNNVMFRDLTPKTDAILSRFNQFEKVKKLRGYRYFLRLNSAEIFCNKNKNWCYFKSILKVVDAIFNFGVSLKNKSFLLPKNNSVTVKKIDKIDEEVEIFIKNKQQNELFKRGKKELNWILENPWIVKKSKVKSNQFYYFSDSAKKFDNSVFKLYDKNNTLLAVLFLTNNNGLVKMPYSYFDTENIPEILTFLFSYLIEIKATSILLFNPLLNQAIQKTKNSFWHIKEDEKDFVVSKKLVPFLPKDFHFQDGESDFVFT